MGDAHVADAIVQRTKKLGDPGVCHSLQATMPRGSEVDKLFLRDRC